MDEFPRGWPSADTHACADVLGVTAAVGAFRAVIIHESVRQGLESLILASLTMFSVCDFRWSVAPERAHSLRVRGLPPSPSLSPSSLDSYLCGSWSSSRWNGSCCAGMARIARALSDPE